MTHGDWSVIDDIAALSSKPDGIFLPSDDKREKRRVAERIRSLSLSAKRFLIADDATYVASSLAVIHPQALTAMLPMARPPFDLMWLEWPLRPQFEALGMPIAADAPEATGVLIQKVGNTVYRMTEIAAVNPRSGKGFVVHSPVSVLFDLAGPIDETPYAQDHLFLRKAFGSLLTRHGVVFKAMDGRTLPGSIDDVMNDQRIDEMIRSCLVGSGYHAKFGAEIDEEEETLRTEQVRLLQRHATWSLTPGIGQVYADAAARASRTDQREILDAVAERVSETSGMWRTVISLLSLMNARDDIVSVAPARSTERHMVRGQALPRLEFGRTTLRVPRAVATDLMRRAIAAGIPRRRHEVAGHWCESHVRGDPSCDHDYVDETHRRRVCIHCGHLMWWRDSHERGDGKLGTVVNDRVVRT